MSLSIEEQNESWVKELNDKLEQKYKLKIGVSKIINIMLELIKENRAEFEKQILTEKALELKVKAFQRYVEEKEKIEKLNKGL